MQVLECYALNEAPPEQVADETQPDVAGMNKHMDAILGFRVGHLMGAPCVTCALLQCMMCHHIMLTAVFGSITDRHERVCADDEWTIQAMEPGESPHHRHQLAHSHSHHRSSHVAAFYRS